MNASLETRLRELLDGPHPCDIGMLLDAARIGAEHAYSAGADHLELEHGYVDAAQYLRIFAKGAL